MKKRERFGSRFAVIAAMAGSAVGLGNIWRFPYVLGQYGGAAFILVYIAASLLVALPIFFAESVMVSSISSTYFSCEASATTTFIPSS